MTTCNFRKKTLHTSFFVYFAFIFSECIKITSFEEVLKVCEHYSFRKYKWKVVLLLIYLFNHESSKSTFFMLNMTSDVLLSTPFTRTLHEHPLHCSVVCPLVVLVCPIVVSVCPFLVPVVLSVGLFITDLLFVLICTFL